MSRFVKSSNRISASQLYIYTPSIEYFDLDSLSNLVIWLPWKCISCNFHVYMKPVNNHYFRILR